MLFEEAETYFSLGTIYRISGIYDTAELMYRTALNIYADLFSNKCEAETLGTLGFSELYFCERYSTSLLNSSIVLSNIFFNSLFYCLRDRLRKMQLQSQRFLIV